MNKVTKEWLKSLTEEQKLKHETEREKLEERIKKSEKRGETILDISVNKGLITKEVKVNPEGVREFYDYLIAEEGEICSKCGYRAKVYGELEIVAIGSWTKKRAKDYKHLKLLCKQCFV